jgi:hypothetical protein
MSFDVCSFDPPGVDVVSTTSRRVRMSMGALHALNRRQTDLRSQIRIPPLSPPLARYRPQGLYAMDQTVSGSCNGGTTKSEVDSTVAAEREVEPSVDIEAGATGRLGLSF